MTMSKNFDVVIVGTGAIGLSAAYLLSKHDLSIAVVAPKNEDKAATAAAGAMIDAFGEIETLDGPHELAKLDYEVTAQRRYRSWLDEIEEDSGVNVFSQEGIVVVANQGGEHDIPKMKLMREKMAEYGEAFEEIDVNDVEGLFPNYLYRAHDAFLSKTGRCVDTSQLVSALTKALENSGNVKLVDAKVKGIDEGSKGWATTLQSRDVLNSSKVIVCAGAHTMNLIKDERLNVPKLYFGRGSSITIVNGPQLPYTVRTPNRALSCGIHMVPQANERLYLGATNLFGVDYSNLPTGPTCGEIHSLLEAIHMELNTNLRNVSIEAIHSGLRPVTQFDEPLCGETNLEGLFVATGTHRTGVHMSPVMAETITNKVMGIVDDTINPFDPTKEHSSNAPLNLRLGVRSLIATALFPGGKLPYNRMDELETYITTILKLVVEPETLNGTGDQIRDILKDVPLSEQGVLQTYHHVLEEFLPEGGPYAS